jgi:hypothetical protein
MAMNEIQLIRTQLTAERQHAGQVANACVSALQRAEVDAASGNPTLGEFRQACVDYLVCVLAWFEERDQRLADLAHVRLTAADPARGALEEVLARPGRSREALEKLEAACAAGNASGRESALKERWLDFARYFSSVWGTRRDGLDALLAANTRVSDWRSVGGIDADSILEERHRYARVCALLPPGVSLTAAPASGAG